MSNVTLEIGGRSFAVACAPGEEAHVADLGRMIGSKLAEMEGVTSQGESRMLLFAALLLADELHEARAHPAPAAPAPAPAPPPAAAQPAGGLPDQAEVLEIIAAQLENLAARLEEGPVSA
ncbi:MAG TPA: cell division protein ZapA [Novosphingobium sp.]